MGITFRRKPGGIKKKIKRVRFKSYPYTVTRVRVMKSKLLSEEDYLRMRKMGLNETIRFLGESEYKHEIDLHSKDYRGAELVELALNENLANVINKLLSISLQEELKMLIQFYALKWILNNIKLVLRTRMNKLSESDLKYGVIPIQPTDYETCIKLYRGGGDEFLEMLSGITNIEPQRLRDLYAANDLVGLENEIDLTFYNRMMELYKKIKMRKSDPLKQFFDSIVQLNNLRNITRFKNEGINEETIRKMLVMEPKGKLKTKVSTLMKKLRFKKIRIKIRKGKTEEKLIDAMIKAEDMKTLFGALKRSKYKELVTPDVEKNPSRLEGTIDRFLLNYATKLLHRKPLSVSPIFGYLLWKEIETKNIKLLVHAKAMGLDENVVDANLIMVNDSWMKVMRHA
ncbi:MAG: V-type ATPase subunit [Candidatus Aenigmatarchaeota archaeon]